MKLNKTAYLPGLMLVLILAIGCAQPIGSTETPPPPVSTVTPTGTMRPTLTLTSTPNHPTDTPTAIPTLSVEAAHAKLLELLKNNGNCALPCLWGITPGKSTYQDAQTILLPLSSVSNSTDLFPSPGAIDPIYSEGDLQITANLRYLFESDGIISHIAFKAGEFKKIYHGKIVDAYRPIYDSKTFGERLRPYMLPGILSEFGKPALVVIQSHGKQITGSGGFEIILLYPDQGMLVHYVTQMKTVGTNARGCPANAQVELELYPAGDADAFAKSLAATLSWTIFAKLEPIDNPSWKSIDIATSMSVEQFYETFRQPTNKCIETPMKGWYVPEQ